MYVSIANSAARPFVISHLTLCKMVVTTAGACRGHVMFPKAKGQGQRGPNKDKENDGRERGERGDKKP